MKTKEEDMVGIGTSRLTQLREEFARIEKILADCETVDKVYSISTGEFKRRQRAVYEALSHQGLPVGFVFSDEHYCGDVPYLGGNTNISIEQVAGVIGKNGFHVVAGLEGGYIAEQLATRSESKVHKVELLQLADEKYPIEAERLEDVLVEANGGGAVNQIGLLTPRQVIPDGVVAYLENLVGRENVIDAQELYFRIKNEKSDEEMRLIRDANLIANAMMRGMLAVLKPGMLETQVAGWGYFIAKELGAEENGWDVMVGANEANRTLIGKALNRPINEGDYVHIGVAPKRDGLNACLRRSVIAVDSPEKVTDDQRFWFDFVESAFEIGYQEYCRVARENAPAREQEQALVDYFRSRTDEVNRRFGTKLDDLSLLKPYTGTHNAGYTECQEFYGAITLDSHEPLGHQIVTMLDVAIRGIGNYWNDVMIPGLDFVVVENTLGKFGTHVEDFNASVPRNVQGLVGR
ncbi:M24 family metallopeptidase [Candidatus Poribacteria bacterium]|nr:M24 family metallopeptidase [Candidatus Poribacteria bacterium]